MTRIDLYRNVHLGQRARLFALATELGAADVGAVPELADRCLAMTQELREHADHEDSFIHGLLRERAPLSADALDGEHVRLDAAFIALDERARSLHGTTVESRPEAQHALYLALNEVISAYLAHLYAEETVAMPALWQSASDEELAAVLVTFRASRTPEEALADLHRMLPALPPEPRAAIVRSVLDAAGERADSTLVSVCATLSNDQRNRLYEDLGVVSEAG